MIEQFFRPDSVEQALELKRRYQDEAVWFAGGSKLNATPVKKSLLLTPLVTSRKSPSNWARKKMVA